MALALMHMHGCYSWKGGICSWGLPLRRLTAKAFWPQHCWPLGDFALAEGGYGQPVMVPIILVFKSRHQAWETLRRDLKDFRN